MKPIYSGDKSNRFWKIIGKRLKTPGGEAIFSLAIALQDIEWSVLKLLKSPKRGKGKR